MTGKKKIDVDRLEFLPTVSKTTVMKDTSRLDEDEE